MDYFGRDLKLRNEIAGPKIQGYNQTKKIRLEKKVKLFTKVPSSSINLELIPMPKRKKAIFARFLSCPAERTKNVDALAYTRNFFKMETN